MAHTTATTVAVAGITTALAAMTPHAAAQTISFRGTTSITETTVDDQHGVAFTITGLSGLTHLDGDCWIAVMDGGGKLVELEIVSNPDGSIASLTVTGGISLDTTRDFEGIATHDDATGEIILSDETGPGLSRHDLASATLLGDLDVPQVFDDARANRGFESLAIRGDELWTANEEALTVDGGVATPSVGTVVRLQRYTWDGKTWMPTLQVAYDVEPMHGGYIPVTNDGQSGLVELTILPDGTLLAMERSLALAASLFETRIALVDLTGATDTSDIASLDGASYAPITKTSLYAGGHSNLEGLGVGPTLGDGGLQMLGIVDDGDPFSTNQIVAFEVAGVNICDEDQDGDGMVGINDLLTVIGAWGPCPDCAADLDDDGMVGINDLLIVIGAWGPC